MCEPESQSSFELVEIKTIIGMVTVAQETFLIYTHWSTVTK